MKVIREDWDLDKLKSDIDNMQIGDSVTVKNYKKDVIYKFVKRGDHNTITDFEDVLGRNHLASKEQVFSMAKDSLIYADFTPEFETSVREDTVKTSDGKWTNKGDEGTHGKFKTKKEADAQRKAMFANGYKG